MKRLIILALLLTCLGVARGQSIAIPSFKGTCNGSISESDGVQHSPNGMNAKNFFALMKQARESHLKLGPDGFLWSTRPLNCDSVAIVDNGHTAVAFLNGDPARPVLVSAGGRGGAPYFFSDSVNLGSGPDIKLTPSQASSCHFYFNRGVTFAQGWDKDLTTVECELRFKAGDGHLTLATVRFTRASQ